MGGQRFDRLARTLSERLSRRAAFRYGAAGAVAAVGTAGLRPLAGAQDATPDASPAARDGDRTFFLFVQSFRSGTMAPKPGVEGIYVLTLAGGPAQTVYFSDRPERIVGTVPTATFLETLGFTPANPPNAAIVAQTDAGEDVLVVELLNPRLARGVHGTEGATATLTYDVRALEDYREEGLGHLAARQVDRHFAETFGPASLIIDDCPDHEVRCVDTAWPPNVIGSQRRQHGGLHRGSVGVHARSCPARGLIICRAGPLLPPPGPFRAKPSQDFRQPD